MATRDFQTAAPATLPVGTKVKINVVGGEDIECVVCGWGAEGQFNFPTPTTPFPIAVFDASGNQITTFGGTAGVVTGDHTIVQNTTNAKAIASGSKKLRAIHAFNNSDAPFYIKLHNTAGVPTPGTGVVRTYGVQAGQNLDIIVQGGGLQFATGIGMTVTAGIGDGDATAVTVANAGVVELEYE